MPKSISTISENELAKLKEKVLKAVLNNQTMPGSNKIFNFPDLPFVLTQPDIYLVDDNIRNTVTIEKINKPVQTVTQEFLNQKTSESGKIVYFQFHSKKSGKDNLVLTLESKVLSSSDQRTSSLTSMQIKFQKVGKEWKMIDEPTSLSA